MWGNNFWIWTDSWLDPWLGHSTVRLSMWNSNISIKLWHLLVVSGHCLLATGPLKKYGTLQPTSDLPASYADVSAQNQQQFTRWVNHCGHLLTFYVMYSIPQHMDFHAMPRNLPFAMEFAACREEMRNCPFFATFISCYSVFQDAPLPSDERRSIFSLPLVLLL